MAARKANRAPLPPTMQQQQMRQPQTRYQTEEKVSVINFGAENSSCDEGSEIAGSAAATRVEEVLFRHPSQGHGATSPNPSLQHISTVSDLPIQHPERQEQQQEMQPPRLKRISYIPNKSTAPPPPPPQQRPQSPPQPRTSSKQLSPSRSTPTVVYQTVYTRPRDRDPTANPAGGNRLTNLFAPTPRPHSHQPQSYAGSNSNLSMASRKSTGSQKSLQNLAGEGHSKGMTLKGRLSSLFRRKNRKQLPQQQQQQQSERVRHQSAAGGVVTAASNAHAQAPQLASRKNLHTFTFTDAKIYNPTNAQVYIGSVRNADAVASPTARSKGPAPPPPTAAAGEINDEMDGRNLVWWNMRTMGATRSSYSTDVLLVRNPDPAPDYNTST